MSEAGQTVQMTLVLTWKTYEGIAVIADTRFGGQDTVSEAGPKIFPVPITLNKWPDGPGGLEKLRLMPMGFAFAGNTFSGQAAHALATACLGNLLTEAFDAGPTVEDVADLYARCAKLVVDERWRWRTTDAHCFDFFVFGRTANSDDGQVFVGKMHIDAEAKAACTLRRIDFDVEAFCIIGDGQHQVMEIVDTARRTGEIIHPGELLQTLINDSNLPSIAGNQQCAQVTQTGVEMRPVMRWVTDVWPAEVERFGIQRNQQRLEYQIMGFDLRAVGKIGRFSPIATHAVTRG